MATLVLASRSPARLATLRGAGVEPVVVVSGVDESGYGDLAPADQVARLAELKARAVVQQLSGAGDLPADALVLGCDSLLELGGRAFGKPGEPDEAVRRWQAMRGRSGVLHTGHHLLQPGTGREVSGVASTTVHFANVDDAEVAAYVATGEPLQVAGGFTLDGLGGAFVTRIEGDHHNVVGVSLPLLRTLVARLGHSWPELWASAAR